MNCNFCKQLLKDEPVPGTFCSICKIDVIKTYQSYCQECGLKFHDEHSEQEHKSVELCD